MARYGEIPAWVRVFLGLFVVAFGSRTGAAQQDPAVQNGVAYLKAHHGGKPKGESAMIALGLLKAEVPPGDPAVQDCLTVVRSGFSSNSYSPSLTDGRGVYEATAALLAFSAQDAAGNKSLIAILANYLMGAQKPNGSWDYTHRQKGDTSISQYAVLGLWEAQNVGIDVPQSVWDNAARWFISVQDSVGGWNYHRDESELDTVAMTAAGVGSLLICQRHLDPNRRSPAGRETSSLLIPLTAEPTKEEGPASTSLKEIKQSITKGMGWIGTNFVMGTVLSGHSTSYALYGVERIGALADRQSIGSVDWFAKGRAYLHSSQQSDGSWRNGQYGNEMDTVWAILFLTKSTAKSIRKIELRGIGAGTLLGGRGLPSDLNSMTVAGGRVVSRPMNGAIEGMLAVIEDPRAEQADSAVAGLAERYNREGPGVLRPFKNRFRKMLSDPDPEVRKVAVWCLARTGDLDVVPALIDVLVDKDDSVVTAAKLGLQLVSRKIEGLGPTIPATDEERRAAASRWRSWYSAIRPLDFDGQDEEVNETRGTKVPAAKDSHAGSAPR